MTLFQNRYRIESTRIPDWDYSARLVLRDILHEGQRMSLGRAVDGQMLLSDAGVIAEAEMKALSTHYQNVAVDRYVIMPNHVHAIVVVEGTHIYSPKAGVAPSPIGMNRPSLSTIVGGYKAGVSRRCHAQGIVDFAWQARFHDHILRSNVSVNAVRDYIDRNPENWILDPDNCAIR